MIRLYSPKKSTPVLLHVHLATPVASGFCSCIAHHPRMERLTPRSIFISLHFVGLEFGQGPGGCLVSALVVPAGYILVACS